MFARKAATKIKDERMIDEIQSECKDIYMDALLKIASKLVEKELYSIYHNKDVADDEMENFNKAFGRIDVFLQTNFVGTL